MQRGKLGRARNEGQTWETDEETDRKQRSINRARGGGRGEADGKQTETNRQTSQSWKQAKSSRKKKLYGLRRLEIVWGARTEPCGMPTLLPIAVAVLPDILVSS